MSHSSWTWAPGFDEFLGIYPFPSLNKLISPSKSPRFQRNRIQKGGTSPQFHFPSSQEDLSTFSDRSDHQTLLSPWNLRFQLPGSAIKTHKKLEKFQQNEPAALYFNRFSVFFICSLSSMGMTHSRVNPLPVPTIQHTVVCVLNALGNFASFLYFYCLINTH